MAKSTPAFIYKGIAYIGDLRFIAGQMEHGEHKSALLAEIKLRYPLPRPILRRCFELNPKFIQ